MDAAEGFCWITSGGNSQPLAVPVRAGGRISILTLQANFPSACGLKYETSQGLLGLEIDDGCLVLPSDHSRTRVYCVINKDNIVPQVVNSARQLLQSPNLLNAVREVGGTSFSPYASGSSRSDGTRGIRSNVRNAWRNNRRSNNSNDSKPMKVVFISHCPLPVSDKKHRLTEAQIDVSISDTEEIVKTRLLEALSNYDIKYTTKSVQFAFLTCNSRTLSIPVVASSYQWTGHRLRCLAGQGRLYVQVIVDDTEVGESTGINIPICISDNDDDFQEPVHFRNRETRNDFTRHSLRRQPSSNVERRTAPNILFQSRVTSRSAQSRSSLAVEASTTQSADFSVYNRYVDIIQENSFDLDDDDDDKDKVHCSDQPECNESGESAEVLLQQLIAQYISENLSEYNIINVVRGKEWETAVRCILRPRFNPSKRLSIKFSDQFGASEGAVDLGGPTREFLQLAMKGMVKDYIFFGSENEKMLFVNASAKANRLYEAAGKLIALSLLHGGPAPQFFSEKFYQLATTGKCEACLDDVPLEMQQSFVSDLSSAFTNEKLQDVCSCEPLSTLLSVSGYCKPITIETKQSLLDHIVQYVVVDRLIPCLDQLLNGLRLGGILALLQKHPQKFHHLFIHSNENILPTVFDAMCQYDLGSPGSNQHSKELQIVAYWRDFLADCAEKDSRITLSMLLLFITGLENVPPLGFEPPVTVGFINKPYPEAHTCTNHIDLPLMHFEKPYDDFKSRMSRAINESRGFGKA